jgi:aspartate/methionine/tyrosine aminotransferase
MDFISKRSKYAVNPLREDDGIARKLRSEGKNVISLNIGDPPRYFPTPKYMIDAFVEALKEGHTGYGQADGVLELREAVAVHYNRAYGSKMTENDVIITQGISEALMFINSALMNPGEYGVLFRPYYVQYISNLKLFGGNAIMCNYDEKNNWNVDTDDLETAIKKMKAAGKINKIKYLLLTNPNNPTGTVLERGILEKIVDIANNYGLFVISDEIYDEIIYNGARFTSVAEIAKGIPHAILNGASKNFDATGFRLGYMMIPEKDEKSVTLRNKLAEYAAVRLSSNVPAQYAMAKALGNAEAHSAAIAHMKTEIEDRVNHAVKLLGKNPYLRTIRPNGAFYIFSHIDLEALGFSTDKELTDTLLNEEYVQLVRGSGFGMPSYIRIVSLAPKDILDTAINKLNSFCERHAKKRG